uniref:Uncharacterized protein n=1 Tax=Anguilla anguilla TaxID=7936 RepID=A0A0E9R9W5_ANGAN
MIETRPYFIWKAGRLTFPLYVILMFCFP